MSSGKHDFRQTAAARLVRAAKAAGCKVIGIEYKGVRVLFDDAPATAAATDAGKNPWDKVLPDAQDTKRVT